MKKYLAIAIGLCIIAIIFATPLYAQKRMAVMGSSTAAGYFPPASGYPKDSAWVWKLKKYYKDLSIVDTVFNIAESGTDCYQGMPSSYTPPPGRRAPNPNLNITRAVNFVPKPNIIIVNYPSNSYDYLATSEIMFCLQTIKDSANAKNIECYITTTQPRDGFSPSERLQLKTLRDSILNRFGSYAIDFYTDIVSEPTLTIKPEYNIGDGVHLTPSGHTLLKDKVLEKNIFLNLVPVRFFDLKITARTDGNFLEWKIDGVSGSHKMIIEAGTNGINFLQVGQLTANLVSDHYSFTHKTSVEGQTFYRIVLIDASGRKEYSPVVSVTNKEAGKDRVKIITGNTLIKLQFLDQLQEAVTVNVLTTDGKFISRNTIKAVNANGYEIDISNFKPGQYVIQVIANRRRQALPFVKL